MDPPYIKIESGTKKSIIDYISLCSKEDSIPNTNKEKSEKPKISIIIPIHNEEKNIIPTIRSIQNQTLKEIEIICINDNCSDNSFNILEKLKKEDPRIILITNKIQRGILYNIINSAIEAKGEYIAYIYIKDFLSNNDVLKNLYEISTKKY